MTLETAIAIAREALKGQVDENGQPYIEHSIRVMNQMDTETEKIVAILHDVPEDSDVILKDLKEAGFSNEVLAALERLTKKSNMTYLEYIEDINDSDLATKVKLAEIEDNMDMKRVNRMSFKTYSPEERKRRSIALLMANR